MDNQLISLTKIFTERIFRIPDFQRGYAWTQKEVSDFWNDLQRLDENKNHYIGVLTLEPVSENDYQHWIEDLWLIKSKHYAPYYVVDGQQRLTTSILLIMAIINVMRKKNIHQLNYSSEQDIIRRFIAESKSEHNSQTYLFGYDLLNPSYHYLIQKIFNGKKVDTNLGPETMYTLNLENAMKFFEEHLSKISNSELETIFAKITQQFLFNTYEISSEIDVFVTFETMNNRGKPLSHLELLKNRLIYLSTLFDVGFDIKSRLRADINNCWKDIYHILGQGKYNYMPDDEFLDAHFHIYFCQSINDIYKSHNRRHPRYYGIYSAIYNYLLDDYFVATKITNDNLTTEDIFNYINSLKDCIQIWNKINNPHLSGFSKEVIEYLYKTNYLLISRNPDMMYYIGGMRANASKILLLACLQDVSDDKVLLTLLKTFEKYLFFISFIPFECYHDKYNNVQIDIIDILTKLKRGDLSLTGIKEKLDKIVGFFTSDESVNQKVINYYKRTGFYGEAFLKYFLCEYETYLMSLAKSNIAKLDSDLYFSKGYDSIEHIYPKRSQHTYWLERFNSFEKKQKASLRNSLGNLVALSQPKNSRLANKPFPEKKDGGSNHIGYKYGTYSEIELTGFEDWGAAEITKRGLNLVTFLQDRWGYRIGKTKKDKLKFLGVRTQPKRNFKISVITRVTPRYPVLPCAAPVLITHH